MKLKTLLLFSILTALPSLAGTVTGNLLTPSGLPVKNGTLTFKLQQVGLMSGTGLVANTTSQCFTGNDGSVTGMPNPSALPIVATQTSGAGNLPGGIYYLVETFYNAAGETTASPEGQIQLTTTGSLIVSLPTSLPAGAQGVRVYIGTTRGGETLQGSFTPNFPSNYAQTVPLVAGSAVPGSNTVPCTIAFNDTIIPYQGYNVSLTSSSGNAYPGWPQAWQLNGGPTGTINVSAGSPLWNGTVVYPMPLLSQPLNHGPQSISGNVDLGGYNLTNVGNLTSTGSFNSQYYPPTIASAITAAGASGSVTIPGSYVGTDTFSANPSGVNVTDQRPLSNTSAPINTVYAQQYGALCNGSTDDTNAINAAIAAAYAYNLPLAPSHEQMTVVLPQGSCLITKPLQLGAHGSLVGQGDSSYLVCDYAAWQGSDYHCLEMVGTGVIGGGASIGQRRIGGFSLIGIGNSAIPNTEAIYIANTSSLYGPSTYAFRNISIDNMLISDFDTALDAQDFADSQISFVNVQDVRTGFNFNGDAVGISITNSHLHNGSWNATSTHTTTYGIIVQANNKYGSGCGTSLYCAPQGIATDHTDVLSFDTDAYQQQCISCHYSFGAFDQAAGGPGGTGYAFQLGPVGSGGGTSITDMTLGTFDPAGVILYSQLNTFGSANGLWIDRNFFFLDAPGVPSGVVGIDLVGSQSLSEASINDNKFSNMTLAINVGQNLTYSSLDGNTGNGLTSALIALAGIDGLVHTGTIVQNNTAQGGVNAVVDGNATGMRVGWNQSNVQFLGTQTVSVAGCTFAAGTIGTKCASPVTVTWLNAFPDSSYTLQCSVQSPATGSTGIASAGIVNGATISVNEVALDTVSTGGGSIVCTGQHQ